MGAPSYLAEYLKKETVDTLDDMTETSSGGQRELPEEGRGLVRFSGYIELGIHSHGKTHTKDKPMAMFEFTLTHKKHQIKVERDGKEITIPHMVRVTVPISNNEGSDYIKIFSALNHEQKAKHPIQLLNKPYLCRVVHSKSEDGKTTYCNLWKGTPKNKEWTFEPPLHEDLDTGETKKVPVPPISEHAVGLRAFLWKNPLLEAWEDLFIEGEFEDDKGNKKSKNWIQEKIKSAKNFKGSALEEMLGGLGDGDDLPTGSDDDMTSDDEPDDTDNEVDDEENLLSSLGL